MDKSLEQQVGIMKTQDVKVELLPTSMTADRYPIHKWFNFVAGYSPEYVDMTINAYKSKTGNKPCGIMDPFAGCATTNVVANNWNIPSYGVERNPFFIKLDTLKQTQRKQFFLLVKQLMNLDRYLRKKMIIMR